MTVASDWLRAKMMVVSSTRELRPLMKIYTKEITSKKIIGMTHYVNKTLGTDQLNKAIEEVCRKST